jgi:hypothetical protein
MTSTAPTTPEPFPIGSRSSERFLASSKVKCTADLMEGSASRSRSTETHSLTNLVVAVTGVTIP